MRLEKDQLLKRLQEFKAIKAWKERRPRHKQMEIGG